MQSLRQLSSRKGLLSTQFLMSFGSSLWQNTVAQQGPLRPPTCQWEQLLQAATQKDVGIVPRGSPCAGRSPLASRGRGSDKHKHLNTHAHPSDQPPPPPLAGAELGGRVRGRGRGAGAHAQQQASRQQPRCARTCDAWQPRCDARAGSSDCAINRADTQNVLGTTVFLHTDLIVSHNNWELKWG